MDRELAVVIPTKNEEGDIEPLFQALNKLGIDMKVVFINDASTDKTGEFEEGLKKKYPNLVDVVHRKQSQGLGKALMDGYKHALSTTDAKFIAQMDGDGQHDPKYLASMLDAAKDGYGVVLGSRYANEGSVGEWGLRRRMTSWGANLLVERALRGCDLHDKTTGYRVFRRDVLETIAKSDISSSGYVFQIDVLALAVKSGARVAEIPIEFKPRMSGCSKLKFRDKIEFLLFAIRNTF